MRKFNAELDQRLFGDKLIKMLGAKTLRRLAEKGKLHDFLQQRKYQGKMLSEYLGGWMKQAAPLRGKKIVAYHKNWTYFTALVGLEVVGYLEPKPGIPPSPGHVLNLTEKMKRENIKVVLAANYFDQSKVKRVTEMTNAKPVMVALAVYGQKDMNTYFDMYDIWIRELVKALANQ